MEEKDIINFFLGTLFGIMLSWFILWTKKVISGKTDIQTRAKARRDLFDRLKKKQAKPQPINGSVNLSCNQNPNNAPEIE